MSSPGPTAQVAYENGNRELAQVDRIVLLQILQSERDALEACRPKIRTLVDSLRHAIDTKGDQETPAKAFRAWKATPAGEQAWELFRQIKLKYPDPAVPRPAAAPATPVTWSATCDAVWADMHTRFDNWRNGTVKNRGHWWGGPPNGGISDDAGAVPDPVVEELRRRIGGRPNNINRESWWRYAASDTGGVAFHRTSGGEDFIYHLNL